MAEELTSQPPLSPKEQAKRAKAELKAEAERNKREAKERAEKAKQEAKAAAKRAKEEKEAAKKGNTVTPVATTEVGNVVDVEALPVAAEPPKSAKELKKEEDQRRKAEAAEAKQQAAEAKQRAKDEKKNKDKVVVEASPEEAAKAPPPPAQKAAAAAPPPPPPAATKSAPKSAEPAKSGGGGSGSGEKKDDKGYIPPPPPPADPPPKRNKKHHVELRAKYNYTALNPDEISLTKGKKYHGFELMENNSWWYGEDIDSKMRGLFPVNYADPIDSKVRKDLEGVLGTGRGGDKKEGDATKLKLTLYAHNLGYATALFAAVMGLFGSLWWAEGSRGNSSQQKKESLYAPVVVWIYSVGMAPCVWMFEYTYGLKRMKSESPYVSPRGIAYLAAGTPLWASFPTMIAAGLAFVCAFINMWADFNREEGDASHVKGSYFVVWFDKGEEKEEKKKKHQDEEELTWIERAREKGVLAQNLIVLGFFAINAALMADACLRWYRTVKSIQMTCIANLCPSDYAIIAKTFGQMLNFNCAMVVFPVLKSALRWANNKEVRPGKSLAAYLPLRKNIIFHRLITSFIFVGVVGHVTAHFINFAFAPEFTLLLFGTTPWVTGAFCTFAMTLLYSGAQNRVKRANYEIFWASHHFFLVFFFTLIAHGPDFWAWSCIPLLCYVADRIYRVRAGNQPFYLRRVLYIPPVMELSFFPAKDFNFREGQYLYLLAPHLSTGEWHPFTISSAHGDLDSKEKKEVTCHIRVQGPKSWTRRLMEYYALMTHSSKKKGESFLLELWHYNSNGEVEPGKYLGPDGVPLISVDGPHAAPAQQYTYYPEVMLVGAGIGLTPSSSILKAICRHKWKKGFLPHVIYFYWVVRHDEIESFRWFVNVLVELEKRLASDRHAGALSPHHYIELNIYVTAAPKPGGPVVQPKKLDLPFASAHEMNVGYDVDIGFDEEKLMRGLLNPKGAAAKQRAIQGGEIGLPDGTRMMDIWIWNGRPKWDDIFLSVKEQRDPSTKAVGCCFCGTPVIGKDLKRHCQEQSSYMEKFRFDLHKENF